MFKTSIVIWSKFDPNELDIEDLAREALAESDSFCSSVEKEFVEFVEEDPNWDEERGSVVLSAEGEDWD